MSNVIGIINFREPIICLERKLMEMEQGWSMMGVYGKTPTEIEELREKHEMMTRPFKEAIKILKDK